MKPNRSVTREKVSLSCSIRTRSRRSIRGVGAVSMVRMTFFSCSTL